MSAPSPSHRWIAAIALVAACAVDPAQDFTETFLVTDPVERIEIDVDYGSVDAISYEREVITLKRHTFGFTRNLGPAEYSVEDGVMRFEAHCEGSTHCTWDHMLELTPGVGFDLRMIEASLEFGAIDGDIAAEFEVGRFKGSRLASPNVTISAGAANIAIDYAAAPEALTIDLEQGDVSIAVPAGAYRCIVAADDGEVSMGDVTCDEAASAVLDIHVGAGKISLSTAAP